MTGYEKLISALRNADKTPCSDLECPGSGECPDVGCLFREAADAIEELQAAVAGYEATIDVEFVKENGHERIRFVPKWIPVTERLPKAGQVLINLHYQDGYNEVSLGEHWNCPDNPMEDGWGGFGGGGVVTHWMPLPEPPKEDE